MGEHRLGEPHQVLKSGKGLIELHHGEFRVVLGGDALVAKVAVDFEDPVEAAHQETLEIQLRGDAQVQGHGQDVVIGFEGPGRGAPGDALHHGGFHFQKAPLVHKLPEQADDAGAGAEDVLDLGVDDQVHVAPAIAQSPRR